MPNSLDAQVLKGQKAVYQRGDLRGIAVPHTYTGIDDQVINGRPRKITRNLGHIGQDSTPTTDTTILTMDTNPVTAPIPSVSVTPSIDWTGFLTNLANDATKVATVAELPGGSTIFPNGAISSGYGYGIYNPALMNAGIGAWMPLLFIGGGLLLIFALAGGRR